MNNAAYIFNSQAKYQAGGVYPIKSVPTITHQNIVVKSDGSHFGAKYPDIFEGYRVVVRSTPLVHAWMSNPMQFWQNQLHFAIWCATTGCGISVDDHLAHSGLAGSVFTFHVYYQIRRILAEMKAPCPQDKAWKPNNNVYDHGAYERICSEFRVSPHTDWRRHGINHGLGVPYDGPKPVKEVSDMLLKQDVLLASFALSSNEWRDDRMNFKGGVAFTVQSVQQPKGVERNWMQFVIPKSKGFTHSGVVRLNDSIRTYVWAILGAQSQTRTRILGTGTAFDAQKQFLSNLEDAISSPVDLPASIKRYQDVLRLAGSEVNFVFGTGLYMAPSNMLLQIGQVAGYNNKIIIATPAQTLGVNMSINHTLSRTTHTGETGLVKPQSHTVDKHQKTYEVAAADHPGQHESIAHEEEKTALVVGGVAVGLLGLWMLPR